MHIMSREKSGFIYVANAWLVVLCHTLVRFDRWNIWSDGCAKEFKSKYVHCFFSWLQSITKKIITYNYYVSHHAHNICDGHVATAKGCVLRYELANDISPTQPEEFVRIIQNGCVDTVCVDMNHIHQLNYGVRLRWQKGIKQFHSVIYRGVGRIITSKQTHQELTQYVPCGDGECEEQDLIVRGDEVGNVRVSKRNRS